MPKKTPKLPGTLYADIDDWLHSLGDDKKPTINDVARFAQVSKRTVSRVINGSPMVRCDTREQVSAIIKRMKFAPDSQARGLAFRHSFLMGLIYDNPNPQYVVTIQEGILEALTGTEFELAVHRSSRDRVDFIEDIKRFVQRQKLFGVVLTPSLSEDERIASLLEETNCHFVRIASIDLDEKHHMIVSHDRMGGVAAGKHLIKLGHKSIAYIAGQRGFKSSEQRRLGLEDALSDAGLSLDPKNVFEGGYTFETGFAAAERMFSRAKRPSAVFAANDEMAAGVIQAAHVHGLNVPGDISVVGFDDFSVAQSCWPRMTTIHSPTHDIGKLAATRLLECAGHPSAQQRQTNSDALSNSGSPSSHGAAAQPAAIPHATTPAGPVEIEPWLVVRDSTAAWQI